MGWSAPRPGRFTPRERPGTLCIGGGVGPRGGLDGYEKSRPPTGIRSPDRRARSESLYRLSYPGPVRKATARFLLDPRSLHLLRSCGSTIRLVYGHAEPDRLTDLVLQRFIPRDLPLWFFYRLSKCTAPFL